MKILIVHTVLWSHYKAQIYSELYRQIQVSGQDVTLKVVHMASSERSRAKLGDPDRSLHQYPYEVLHPGFIEDFKIGNRLRALMQIMRTYRPDVINVPGYYDPVMVLVMLYCRIKGIRIILSNDSTSEDNQRVGWKETLKRRIISMADGFFCYGSLSAGYMLELGARPEQILQRRNAVDNTFLRAVYDQALPLRQEKQTRLGLRKHNFIFVGRLIDRLKNVSGLLEAYAKASQQQPEAAADWGLIFLGNGEDHDTLETAAAAQQLEGVRFLSGTSWQEIPAYLALSDVLVLPSFSEPWGLVVNEAMACGLPVLVSDRCGCAIDLVRPGENGYTFDPGSTDQLAQLMLSVMTGAYDLSAWGKKSEEIIAYYKPDLVAKEMLDGFASVLGRRHRSAEAQKI